MGGWNQARQMRIAVAAVWDSVDDIIALYEEADTDALLEHLRRADAI